MKRELDIDQTQHDFSFNRNWFRHRNLPTFREFVAPKWAGKPIVYLEIGVYEAMSMVWMLQRILTHPDSRAIGIDPWVMSRKVTEEKMDVIRGRAYHNLEPWTYQLKDGNWKCELFRSTSVEILGGMSRQQKFGNVERNTLDLCMIDGCHHAGGALDDARLTWPLMKKGGWLLFDDVENTNKFRHHVKEGLGIFLKERSDYKRVFKHRHMECFEKV